MLSSSNINVSSLPLFNISTQFQLQGVKWIKQKYGDKLRVIRLGQRGYLDTIEKAIIKGETVLFENIGETVDPVLDPLLGRTLIKKGRWDFKAFF